MPYNPFETGDAQPVQAPKANYDPFKTGDAQPVYDPFKTGDAISAQSSEQPAKSSDAALSNEDLRKQFEEDYARSGWSKVKDMPSHIWNGLTSVGSQLTKDAPEELGQASTGKNFGNRILSTVVNSKARALQELSEFALKVGMSPIELAKSGLNYLNPPTKEEAWREFQEKYFRRRAEAAQPPSDLAKFATTVAEPFSNIAEQVAGPAATLPATERALATAEQLAVPEAALGVTGKLAKVTDAAGQLAKGAALARGAGKVAQAGGRVMEDAGNLPKTLIDSATDAAVGPATDTALSSLPSVVDNVLDPLHLGKFKAAAKAGAKVGAAVRGAGEVVEAMAKAPADSIWGRMHYVATSEGAPNWMKTFLSSRVAKTGEEVARVGKDIAKGAATGGAIGALYGIGDEQGLDELGESIGGGVGIGGGMHALKAPGSRNRAILQRTAAASADLLKQHLQDGVPPEALRNVPDSAWSMAAALQQHPGIDAKVRFVTPEQFADLQTPDGSPLTDPGAGGVWDRSRKIVWINLASRRGVTDTLIHEMGHPIFDNAVLRQPEISRTIDAALAEKGQTIDNLKRTYVEALMSKELEAMPDYQTREAAIQNRLAAYDAAFPGNSWAYSEALSENYVNSLKSKDVLHLDPTVADVVRGALKSVFGGEENAKGFFKDFSNVVQSPELSRLSRGLLRTARDHTLGEEDNGVTLTPEMFGQRPEAPLHDLPNGERGNDFVVASPDGVRKRAPSAIRKIIRDRVAAVRGLFDPKNVKGLGDSDPEVSYRRTKTGGEEISGTVLPQNFYNLSVYSNDTKNIARAVQEAIKTGDTLGSWYHQVGTSAGSKTWAQSVRQSLGAFTAKFHDYQPFGWRVDKQGNLSAYVFDRQALTSRLADWANRKGLTSLEQWGGDRGKAMQDIVTYLDNHVKGLPGETTIGPDKANTINALLTGKTESNPLAEHLTGKDRQGIVRSLRLDRIETLEPSQQKPIPRPNYGKLTQNFSPSDEANALFESSPEDYNRFVSAFTGPYGGGQTGWSFELGSRVKSTQDLARLRELHDQARLQSKEARANGDMGSAFHWAYKAQAFREAYEAATDETFSGSPSTTQEFINSRINKDFKTPMPKDARTPEAAASGVVEQAASEAKANQLFSPSEENAAHAVTGEIPVFHFSRAGDKLKVIDPAKMDLKNVGKYWEPKPLRSFFFVKGAATPNETGKFAGRSAYAAKLDGKKIYDATGSDPLGFFKTWPISREKYILDAGFDGVLISANGGKDKIVISYKPVKVKLAKPGTFSPDAMFVADSGPGAKPNAKGTSPNDEVRSNAAEYMQEAGLPYNPHTDYAPVNVGAAKRIADWFEATKHEPLTPAVKASYDALAAETLAQYNFLQSKGVKVEPWTNKGEPYKNSAAMLADVRDNKHLWYFKTDEGFGETAADQQHPLLAKVKTASGEVLPVNDLFRAVHDYFGHAKEGYEFGPRGELNAYLAHSSMFSEQARPAMAAETLAQNSWVNYGKHLRTATGDLPQKGEAGYVPPANRPFADQKATVVPEDLRQAAIQPFSPEADKVVGRLSKRIPALLGVKRKAGATSPGVTFNVARGQERKNGFAVSLYPDLSQALTPEQFNNQVISDFLRKHLDLLSDPENSLGIWDDTKGSTGKVWLDVVATLSNRDVAEYAGRKYNQVAIGDLDKYAKGENGDIAVGGNGQPPSDLPPASERLNALKSEWETKTHEPVIKGPVTQANPEPPLPQTRVRPRQKNELDKLSLQHVLDNPDMENYGAAIVKHFRTVPGFKNISPSDTHAALKEISRRMEDNLSFWMEKVTSEERDAWKRWYDIAHDMSHDWGKEFGKDWHAVAAINAKFSPQTPWFDNITLTRRFLETMKEDPETLPETKQALMVMADNRMRNKNARSPAGNKKILDQVKGIEPGKRISELNDAQAGMVVRMQNELAGDLPTHNHLLEPEGGISAWNVDWPDLEKIVSIWRDPSRENVNKNLGRNHKVRSFYNNHVAPESPDWTTVDTHAMAAALMLPLGGSDEPVKKGFGGISHKASGYKGTYFLYQHAYEQVAKKFGLLPREVQSIVWEKARQSLTPEAKHFLQEHPTPLKEIHNGVNDGRLTPEIAREAILKLYKDTNERETEASKKAAEPIDEENNPF